MQIDSHPYQIWTFTMWVPSDVCCFINLMKFLDVISYI
jgi:hypothetical protein